MIDWASNRLGQHCSHTHVPMSSRITRSSVRHAAIQAGQPPSHTLAAGSPTTSTTPAESPAHQPATAAATPKAPAAPALNHQEPATRSSARKRKSRDSINSQPESSDQPPSARRPKRQKALVPDQPPPQPPSQSPAASTRSRKGKALAAMSSPE